MIVKFQLCKQLTKTFGSNVLPLSIIDTEQLCIANQGKYRYQYQRNYEPLQHHMNTSHNVACARMRRARSS